MFQYRCSSFIIFDTCLFIMSSSVKLYGKKGTAAVEVNYKFIYGALAIYFYGIIFQETIP